MNKVITWVLVVGVAATACDDDQATDGTAVGTTGVAATSSSDGVASSSGAADDSSGGAPAGPPVCTKMCTFPGECCPPGAEGCPSTEYPFNYTCPETLCILTGCQSDEDCGGLTCLTVFGVGECVQTCAADADCAGVSDIAVCTGVDDAGASYCLEPCNAPGMSCGNMDCDETTGRCTCSSSGQCIVGFECV